MNELQIGLIILFTVMELLILCGVLLFYLRFRKAERLLNVIQGKRETLLAEIEMNARLEKDIVASYATRQAELKNLNEKIEQRAQDLRRLLDQAEGITRSPQFLRELILNGQRKGLSAKQIARNAGLSVDEVELIMSQNS